MEPITRKDVLAAGAQLDTVCEKYGLKESELQIIFQNMMVLVLYQVQQRKGPYYDVMRELLAKMQDIPMVGLIVKEHDVTNGY
jgi:hypothetical protein